MQEQDYLHEDFDTPPSEGGTLRPRKVTSGQFGPRPWRWRRWVSLALLLFTLIVWPVWANFYTDWLWFNELGFQVVFSTVLIARLLCGLVGGVVAALLFWLSLCMALRVSRQSGQAGYKFFVGNQEVAIADAGKFIAKLALPLSAVVGIFFGLQCAGVWDEFLLFRHGVSFGEQDPVLGHDISFYFFRLPLLDFISGSLLLLLVLALLAAIVVYLGRAAISLNLGDENGKPSLSVQPGARQHLLVLVAAVFAVLAYRYYLDLPALLYGNDGTVAGAGYLDTNVNMPLLWAHVGASLLLALAALASLLGRGIRLLMLGGALLVVVMVVGFIYPALVQRFSVAPNELQKESPYLALSIAATRKAYNLDNVEERELAGDVPLSAQDMQENRRTINGIRIWDQAPLLSTFGQLQEIRPYYKFQNVDNDRYRINGEEQQVMLSVRELESEKLQNRNWINERLIFTHGYGLTLGPVNQITPEGLPVLYVKDIPPVSTLPSLKIERPEIYYGEMENAHVFVRTKQQEFNFPEGEKNQFSTYTGTGGVSLGSYYRKLLFSTRLGELKLMLSDDMTAESRVLMHRNIIERLNKIAPFLLFDRDPYLVISEGKCFWICDAYTTSNRYPYASGVRFNQANINYVRNSVKAVVDAYNGSVQLYIADDHDPVIQTYARILPGILQPLSAMPTDLRAHLRYPEDIFRIQTRVYATYHMDQPTAFYNKEDQWEIASGAADNNGQAVAMEPYYTIMKLPGAATEEFLVMLPFVPANKLNLAAWMVARCDPEHYGKLVIYRIPKQKQIYGPKQVINRINADTEISGQVTLWNQRGSKLIWGTMLVIPIKESLLYVQPLYLQAEGGKPIPELKRVIVVHENKIAMGENLEQSLNKLFGSGAMAAPPSGATAAPAAPLQSAPATGQPSLGAQALQHYDRAQQALKEGNWAQYGEELKRLRTTLEELSRQK